VTPLALALVGLLGAVGTFLGGLGAFWGVRNNRRSNALDALKLALATYQDDNERLRERVDDLAAEIAACERKKGVQEREIAQLRDRVDQLEAQR
jgi:cell division protein FtsB